MNEKSIAPVISPIHSEAELKEYYCPHCDKILMRVNVSRLSMTCPHCSELINATENDLIKIVKP